MVYYTSLSLLYLLIKKSLNKNYQCGEISANKLKIKINNKFIMCKSSNKDRYNRFIAECFTNKTNINNLATKKETTSRIGENS